MTVELDIEAVLQRVRQNGHDIWVAGPQSEVDIATVEAALQVRFPPSYRQFLLRYGAMSIHDSHIVGIINRQPLSMEGGSIYGTTVDFRQEQGLSDYLVVIEPDDEAPYCFDTRHPDTDGEFPINCYELYSGADGKIADNFPQFIAKWFLEVWVNEKA